MGKRLRRQDADLDGWSSAGAAVQGVPAVAALGATAYIVARDQFNAYWTNTFTRGSGFGGWVNRGRAFATDPANRDLSCKLL